jgi:hypothetical protein
VAREVVGPATFGLREWPIHSPNIATPRDHDQVFAVGRPSHLRHRARLEDARPLKLHENECGAELGCCGNDRLLTFLRSEARPVDATIAIKI